MPEPAGRPPYEGPDDLTRRGELLAGRYRLHEQIGAGGMAVVHRGHDTVLDRPVAVKIAHVDDPTFRRCLHEEARAFGRLNHPRIAQIHDFGGTPDGRYYIVMELVTGEPLHAQVTAGPLDPPAAIRIAGQIAEALAAVHAVGLVHRDVKPDNVIVTGAGAKLVDFGISAPVGEPDGDPDGRLLGTPAYVAPERITNTPVGPASDVYSLGVLLYGMLTATTPFRGRSRTEVLRAHLNDHPAPLPAIAGLPAGIADLCAACLARDPRDRPTAAGTAATLTAILTASLTATPVDPTPPARGRRRYRPALVAAGATVLAMAAAGWASGLDRHAGTAATAASAPGCQISFTVVGDTGSQFTAALAVTNLGPAIDGGWRLDLVLRPGQRIIRAATPDGDEMTVTQTTDRATLHTVAPRSLATGATAHIGIRASYHGANLLPTDFRFNGRPCRTGLASAVDTSTPPPTPGPTGAHTPPAATGPGTTTAAAAVPGPTTAPTVPPTITPPSPAPTPSTIAAPPPPPPTPPPTHGKNPKPTKGHG